VIVSSGPVTFCLGDSVTLTATPVSASYLWSNGSTTQSINVSYAGNFSVNITDLNGCVSPPSTILSTLLFPPPVTPVINAQGPVPFCTGQNVTLDATGGLASFQWSNGQSTSSILVSQAGQFSVWGIDANGCETDTSAPFLVSLFPVPTSPIITASGPLTFCAGNSVQLSSSSPIGNLWSNGANTQNIVVSQTTIGIQVGYTDANGCPSPLSLPIDVNVIPLAPTPVISPSGSTILCEGDSVELICSQAQSFLWSTGETSQSIWVSQTGTVDVVVTDICNPATPQSSINIVVHPKPLADFQILKKIVCIPEPVEAQNLSQGNSIIQSWMLGDGTTQTENHLSHVFQFPGIYDLSIVVTDINGCTSTKTMIDAFEVHGTPVIEHTIHPRVSEEYGSSVHGHVLSEGVLNGQWTISDNNFPGNQFDFQPTVSGVIPVKFIGETQEGCTIEISDSILVKEAEKAFIPIAFTPNGDGKNDFFQPFISGFEGDYLFKIFNRWGGVIFSSNNPDYSWDGVGFPEGVYIWTLSFRGNNGSIIEKTGQVTLYR
jgi:gliding motility-associated-like protein